MLNFHILNVGHGSSIVVELIEGATRSFGVVDSNSHSDAVPRALTKLQELGADRLAFICLTHLHRDHYSGLAKIIDYYSGRIDHFYSCYLGDVLRHRDRLRKLADQLSRVVNRSDGEIRQSTFELIQILFWADHNKDHWFECAGEENQIAPPGFKEVNAATILPVLRTKGSMIEMIENEDPLLAGSPKDNEISLALRFEYRGKIVVLGGDATAENWRLRRRHFEKNAGREISASAVNLPHHGSRTDCSEEIIDQLFSRADTVLYGISSADGLSHPSPDVIRWLEARKIQPYCTNLIPMCGANILSFTNMGNIDPELARYLREVNDRPGHVHPCQGDITISIDRAGQLKVVPQFGNACGFRGGFAALGA